MSWGVLSYSKTGTSKKRATCFAALLQNEPNNFVRFNLWLVKRATSPFKSFCSKVAKQIARVFFFFARFTVAYLFVSALKAIWFSFNIALK